MKVVVDNNIIMKVSEKELWTMLGGKRCGDWMEYADEHKNEKSLDELWDDFNSKSPICQ